MQKKCLANEACPLSRGYNAIGDWWSLLIVSQLLLNGPRRFGEIQESLKLARNILTARLKKLVEEGIVEKVSAVDGRAHQPYALTATGHDLYTVVVALRQWGDAHFPMAGECGGYVLVDAKRGEAIPPVQVRSADGRVLGPGDLRIAPAGEKS